MPSPLHQRILDVLRAQPRLVVELLAVVEPERREFWLERRWVARVSDPNLRAVGLAERDTHRIADLVICLFPADLPARAPAIVIVVECQLGPDPEKYFSWSDYLSASRRENRCPGRVMVLSPLDTVIDWAEGLFVEEPWLTPRLIGRAQIPWIADHGRALREPELALLSAIFHGPHERGVEVVHTAAIALRSLPRHKRREYVMLLEDVLPEELMPEVRRIALEEAQQAADQWMRTRGPYRIGHREGLVEGREEGREEGLLRGRHDALAWILEARGLTPSPAQQAQINACTDLETLERWCLQAKTAASITALLQAS